MVKGYFGRMALKIDIKCWAKSIWSDRSSDKARCITDKSFIWVHRSFQAAEDRLAKRKCILEGHCANCHEKYIFHFTMNSSGVSIASLKLIVSIESATVEFKPSILSSILERKSGVLDSDTLKPLSPLSWRVWSVIPGRNGSSPICKREYLK